jgi:hypothetical protein
LLSLFFRDVAELEEVFFWKSDRILPPGVPLAFKQMERIAKCVGQFVQVKMQGLKCVGLLNSRPA